MPSSMTTTLTALKWLGIRRLLDFWRLEVPVMHQQYECHWEEVPYDAKQLHLHQLLKVNILARVEPIVESSKEISHIENTQEPIESPYFSIVHLFLIRVIA